MAPLSDQDFERIMRLELDDKKKDVRERLAQVREIQSRIDELEGRFPQKIKYLNLEEIAKHGVPKLDWLITDWIVRGDVAMLAGGPGIGKTTLGADLAIGAALGSLGHLELRCPRPLRVLYFDEEQGEDMTARLMLQLGAPVPGLSVASGQRINLTDPNSLGMLEREIRAERPDLVVIDSVQQTFAVESAYDSIQVGAVYGSLFQMRDAHKVTFLLIHHLSKRGQKKVDLIDLVRDSTAHVTQCSAIFVAEGESQDSMRVTGVKRRGAPKPSMIVGYREGLEGRIHLERRAWGEPSAA